MKSATLTLLSPSKLAFCLFWASVTTSVNTRSHRLKSVRETQLSPSASPAIRAPEVGEGVNVAVGPDVGVGIEVGERVGVIASVGVGVAESGVVGVMEEARRNLITLLT